MRVYRKLQISDLPLVIGMGENFRANFICEENARQFLMNPMNWIFACIQDQKIIGFAYGYELNRLDQQGNMLYIHEVGVLPDFQRQGIGLQLLMNMKMICERLGICRFFLFTQRHNQAACALYEKAGGHKGNETLEDDVTYFFKIG
ncbi:MAG: GNAT family N-acetyltransferase [Firmicutes bacterium]|nr:GNAT family N-acetyltransferase [Bacillota bacterium]